MSDHFAPSHRTCPQCQAEVPEDGTNGLCPACLLQEAMKPTEAKTPTEPKKRWEPPQADDLSKLLPQYEITRMLGRGGMGAVYQGRQKSLDRAVAIKILSHDLDSADASFAERFKNEARAMARLSHPGIVAVYDSGETSDGLLYIVMEFIEGTDVARMMAANGRLHSNEAMAITAHVCDALSYAHERGIVHRDIKPANIMIGYNGVVKVADFGLAKMVQEDKAGLTQSGMAMGTLYYMAPEALMLGAGVDHRADIYAVGVMLYQMLTGKLPQGMFELPSMQIPGLDPRYDGIVAKALREDRELRYANTQDMRHDLDALLTQPVTKAQENDVKPPPALDTQARPQRPSGQPYRPQRPQVPAGPTIPLHREKEKKSSPLLWVMLVALLATGAWLVGKRPWETAPASKTAAAPKPQPQWINLLGDDPTKLMEFDASADRPSGLVLMPPNPGDQNPRYKVQSGVEIYTKTMHKNGVLRARISGTGENCPYMMVRHRDHLHHVKGSAFRGVAVLSIANGGSITFAQGVAAAHPPPFEIELRVDGHEYTLLKDGVLAAHGFDDMYESGHVGVRLFGGMTVEKLEYLDVGEGHLSDVQPPLPEPKVLAVPALAATSREIAGAGPWRPLLQEKPQIIERLDIRDSPATPGWKMMQQGFMPVIEGSNVALRLRARGRYIQFVSHWSETPEKGIHGHLLSLAPERPSETMTRLLGGWIDRVSSVNGVVQPTPNIRAQPDGPPSAFDVVIGKDYELELRSWDDRLELLVDGKLVKAVRDISLPGKVLALYPALPFEFKDLEWRQLTPAGAVSATPAGAAPAGSAPLPASTTGMELVVEADFAQPLPHFRDAKSPHLEMKWQDQSYRMTAMDKAIWWPGLPLLSQLRMTDFVCEAEFRMPRSANGKWGIGLHVPQKMPWIGVGMTSQGRVDVFRYDEKFIVPPTVTTAHPAGADAWDTLRMEAVGSRLRVFVNGLHVADADTTGLPSPHGLNLFMGTPGPGLEVWFRRLRVWQPASTTPPPTAPVKMDTGGLWRSLLADKPEIIQHLKITDSTTPGWKVMQNGFMPVIEGPNVALRMRARTREMQLVSHWGQTAEQGIYGHLFTLGLDATHTNTTRIFARWIENVSVINGLLQPRGDQPKTDGPPPVLEVPAGQDFELELRSWADRLELWVGGRLMKESRGITLPGHVVALYPATSFEFKDLEWRSLPAPAAPSAATSPTTPQLWTDRAGSKMRAAFVRLEQDRVVFSISGKETIVMLHTLSDESQNQARMLGAAQARSAPVVTATPPPASPATASAPATAPPPPSRKVGPVVFVNSLGMTFVDVPGTKVQFCTHETRFRDFMTYANTRRLSSSAPWTNQTYGGHSLGGPAPDHPVVHVTPENAQSFCTWLSLKEGRTYRLPTDAEWTAAVTARPATGPDAKKPAPRFPWGSEWPPPRGAGNYSDESYHRLRPKDPYLPRYEDGYPTTAPVQSYTANAVGLYDLGGNVWEWVSLPATVDAQGGPRENFALRGASFLHNDQDFLLSSRRLENIYSGEADRGFRIVLEK
ncbi:bifunctional serine/threonine-protein kinase/formylglycine-generating enzyme family protein [Prosthecobacter fluviatilis]|uniref:Protein kinase n=1 Tax=Prosthecobacter fluviatilis TaxID=445931 RepID=A0ABW0KNG8_9BACT